jgi:hypothetical protein
MASVPFALKGLLINGAADAGAGKRGDETIRFGVCLNETRWASDTLQSFFRNEKRA